MEHLPFYKPTETEIKKEIRRYLKIVGIFNWNQWQGQFSVRGVPDLIGILPKGRILAIEVKKPGWKPNEKSQHWQDQKAFIERINEEGGLAFVATSVQDVIDKLEGIK